MKKTLLALSVVAVTTGCGGSSATTAGATSTGGSGAAPPASGADNGGADMSLGGVHDGGAPPGATADGGVAGTGCDGGGTIADGGAPADGGTTDGGSACTDSVPVSLQNALASPFRLKTDDQFVYYFTQQGTTRLWRLAKTGGTPQLVTNALGGLNSDDFQFDYAVDANYIYVMHDGGDVYPASVDILDKSLNPVRTATVPVASTNCPVPHVTSMAVRDGRIYLAQLEGPGSTGSCTGPVPYHVVEVEPGAATGTIVATVASFVTAVAATHDAGYWTNEQGTFRLPEGAAQPLALNNAPSDYLVSDGGGVYFMDVGGIHRSDANGITNVTSQMFQFQVDDGATLYGVTAYGNGAAGSVGTIPQASPIVHVANSGSGYTNLSLDAFEVTVDDSHLYYIDANDDLMRTCK
ncbi:MAG TPA: hypothetical protein VIA18_28730 [Polyangia bacterium]|jgi:hypothetical protein|nr:hypothetical protein [Polyangia bacterium]